MRYLSLSILSLALLTACGTAPKEPAIIVDISESSIKIQRGMFTKVEDVEAAARQGCQMYNRRPVSLSFKCNDQYCLAATYLFACIP